MFDRKGLIIDKENNRYKKYVSVLFFKVGDWKPLPGISFVALTRVRGAQTFNSPRTFSASATVKLICFVFIYVWMLKENF